MSYAIALSAVETAALRGMQKYAAPMAATAAGAADFASLGELSATDGRV